jgi:hypothetical protein
VVVVRVVVVVVVVVVVGVVVVVVVVAYKHPCPPGGRNHFAPTASVDGRCNAC